MGCGGGGERVDPSSMLGLGTHRASPGCVIVSSRMMSSRRHGDSSGSNTGRRVHRELD